ncbi:hypothetical protein D9757_009077 [Collybiopsis confluens]|uniref:Pheromone receptor n=1 Tax=Collybiopsis confluens TaxID=2823264 RepID=A0A8H5M4Z7_9AGAR|nr:hypothetical protein D9757_009077 [Collybiopsis confluens]
MPSIHPMATFLYPFFPIFSFFGFFLPLIPLTWHIQAWNTGSCFYMMWASMLALIQFVNSIVWSDNVLDVAPIWCDISTHIFQAGTFAIPLSSLCIIRRLYLIASSKTILNRIEKRRMIIFDVALCLVLPVGLMALEYIFQGRRYQIDEEIGCMPYLYRTLSEVLFAGLPEITAGLVSAVYGVLCLLALFRHFQELKAFFVATKASSFTSDRFIPIVALTVLQMMCTTPLAIYSLVSNIESGLLPWISWDNVHSDFNVIVVIPSSIWRSDLEWRSAVESTRWIISSFGIIIFLFYGTTREARRHYLKVIHSHNWKFFSSKDVSRFTFNGDKRIIDIPDNSLTESIASFDLPLQIIAVFPESEEDRDGKMV